MRAGNSTGATMSIVKSIIEIMSGHGWQPLPVRQPERVDARLRFEGAARLELEHRPEREELWLWIHAKDDRRCLGLEYGARLNDVLVAICALQQNLSIASYIGAIGDLQKVCPTSVIAWEQFEIAADRLVESYAVQLLYAAAPPGLAGEALDAEGLEAALSQTWSWPEARAAVEQARVAVTVADEQAGGTPRQERLSQLVARLRQMVARERPLAIWWAPAQRILPPEALADDNLLHLALNVRFFPRGGPLREGEAMMDTRGLDVFGLPDLECRFFEADPGYIAERLFTIAGYVWAHGGEIFDEDNEIGGLGDEPWFIHDGRSLASPDRPVLQVEAGRFTRAEEE
jgi:hypothetical protein